MSSAAQNSQEWKLQKLQESSCHFLFLECTLNITWFWTSSREIPKKTMPAQKEQFQVAKIRVPRRSLSQLKLPQWTDKKHWSSTKLKASNQSNKLINKLILRDRVSQRRENYFGVKSPTVRKKRRSTQSSRWVSNTCDKKHWWQMVSEENTNWPTSPVKLESVNGSHKRKKTFFSKAMNRKISCVFLRFLKFRNRFQNWIRNRFGIDSELAKLLVLRTESLDEPSGDTTAKITAFCRSKAVA